MAITIGFLETEGITGAFAAADKIIKNHNVKIINVINDNPPLVTVIISGQKEEVDAALNAGALEAGRTGKLKGINSVDEPEERLLSMFLGRYRGEIKKVDRRRAKKNVPPKTVIHSAASAPAVKSGDNGINSQKQAEPVKSAEIKSDRIAEKPVKKIKKERTASLFDDLFTDEYEEYTEDSGSEDEIIQTDTAEQPNYSNNNNAEGYDSMSVHELRRFARSIDGFPIRGREISRANKEELLEHIKKIG